ncbi:hypothetical protein L6452_28876 [Arctium lappa]|uniref:Uncharacterized protein n=1 Tax=Arctium lappa TaxID=4217 RepID=A0ACB9A411_ARCLA|nr:hypothetical protein L6452_28876 [Arctium lappa]
MGMSPSEALMSPEGAVIKLQKLKKWRRKPRELVKKTGSNLDGRKNEDLTESDGSVSSLNTMVNVNGDSGFGGTKEDSENSEDRSSRSSTAASAPRKKHEIVSLSGRNSGISVVVPGDQQRNGVIGTSKKARGFKMEMENSHSSMGSDSRSSNFVFVQGTNSIASKGKQSGRFTSDKHLDEEAGTAFVSYADFEDVSREEVAAENKEENKDDGSVDQDDAVAKSLTGFDSAHEKLARELQKLKEVGKDDSKISELESTLASGEANTKLEDLLKKMIQAEVEYVAISTTTESMTAGLLHEIKLNLRQKNIEVSAKKEAESSKLETREDVKKLRNRVCRFTSCVMIQLILLLVILYLQFSSPNVEVVPT